MRYVAALVFVFTATLLGCEGSPASSSTAASSAAPPAATVTASAAAPSAAPKAPARPADPLAGRWEGAYEAKKGAVSLPPKVKDKGLAGDDGKAASGAGTVEIGVGADGTVMGKIGGALGACTVHGKAEEGVVRAQITPDDPRAPGAMTGVLMGKLEGETIRAEIQVAGPDATVVRQASVTLKRKEK